MGFNDRFWGEEITLNYLQNCKSYNKMKSGESESEMGDIHIEAQVRQIWRWHTLGFDKEGGAMSPGMQVAYMSWNMQKNDFLSRAPRSKARLPTPWHQPSETWFRFLASKESRCSVAQPSATPCDPGDCSTPGFPVLSYLPGFAQTERE